MQNKGKAGQYRDQPNGNQFAVVGQNSSNKPMGAGVTLLGQGIR